MDHPEVRNDDRSNCYYCCLYILKILMFLGINIDAWLPIITFKPVIWLIYLLLHCAVYNNTGILTVSQVPRDCDFPVNQLTKVVWGPVKVAAPEAFHIISKMSFSDFEYDQLIASASRHPDLSLTQIACQWVQNNEQKWEKWLPTSLMEKPKIYLGGLFPLSGKTWSQPGLVEGKRI